MNKSKEMSRRDVFQLAAGAVAVSAIAAVTAPAPPANMPALAREWFALHDAMRDRTEGSDTELDDFVSVCCARQNEIEEEMNGRTARIPADAIAHLEVARDDMIRFRFGGTAYSDRGDGGDHLTLSAIDNALRVLRGLVVA